MITSETLLQIKEAIEDSKKEISEATGKQTILMEQLQTMYGVKDIKKAKKKLEDLNTEIQELEAEIEQGIVRLEEKYEL